MGTNPWIIVLKFVTQHARLLVATFLVLLLGSYGILRLFVEPLYLSQAVIYPANIKSVSAEDPTEQVLQILNSSDIRDKIVDSFGLVDHYGLTGRSYLNYELQKKYNKHFEIVRTTFSSIEINVLDKDRDKAAEMANAIIKILDKKIRQLSTEKFVEWARFEKEKYDTKLAAITKVENDLNRLKADNGIINYEEQSAIVATEITKLTSHLAETSSKISAFKKINSRAYRDSVAKYQVILAADQSKYKSLDSLFKKYLVVGDKIEGIVQDLLLERETMAEYKMKYEEALQNTKRKITYSLVVSSANAADKAEYPKKGLISIIVSISGSLLLILLLIAIENIKAIRSELN